uniref:Uncharacterized protein n=1 Tax=Cucumis melo TaxID=3656 RepID=A0A9I9EF34_CUCME
MDWFWPHLLIGPSFCLTRYDPLGAPHAFVGKASNSDGFKSQETLPSSTIAATATEPSSSKIVNRIQKLRKQATLEPTDTVEVMIEDISGGKRSDCVDNEAIVEG